MKKSKLVIDYAYDFFLAGVVSSVNAYKLAWEINNALGIRLVRHDDLVVGFKGDSDKHFAYYAQRSGVHRLKLFRNKALDGDGGKYLVPEYTRFDYVILRHEGDGRMSNEDFVDTLRRIEVIQLVAPIPVERLKSKANFIF